MNIFSQMAEQKNGSNANKIFFQMHLSSSLRWSILLVPLII